MMRIHSVFFINELHSEVSSDFTNNVIAPCLLKLAEDPVPNIRFNVSKSILVVAKNCSQTNIGKFRVALGSMAENDKDFDA